MFYIEASARSLIIIFVLMILNHLIADYNLQGWLASAKQKEWWATQTDNKLYKNDYLAALICHSTMWSILVMLPLIVLNISLSMWVVALIINIVVHSFIDHLKANEHMINLCQDQVAHLLQIVFTFMILISIS